MAIQKRRVLDSYLKRPIMIDVFGIISIQLIWYTFPFISFAFTDKPTLLNITASLIGTCISLAGFILAALTIIVTFRSNLKAKGVDTSDNALELIITSGYYKQIVDVYIGAIYEFIFVSFGMYLFWLSIESMPNTLTGTKIVLSGVLLTAAPVYRSLWVLFSIIGLEKHDKQ